MGIGDFDLGDVFTGEIGREPALPELMLALDFPLGLGRGGIKETDVVELEGPAELSEGFGILREKDGVIIDVDLQRTAMEEEGGGEEIEIGQQEFPFIEFGADKQAAAIIEHIEHGKVEGGSREPAMGRSVQLPEFTDLGTLPAAHRGVGPSGRGCVGMPIFHGPMSDLGAVELEGVEPHGFRGGEAVGGRRAGRQAFYQEVDDGLRPGAGVITARNSRDPQTLLLARAGAEVIGAESVEAAAGEAKLFGGFKGRQGALAKRSQDMADEGGGVAMGQLLILFKSTGSARRIPTPSPFVGLRYAPAFLKDWAWGYSSAPNPRALSCFANYRFCPGLLHPRH